MSLVYLSDLKVGDEAMIIGFSSEDIPTKLYEIGIVPGIHIKLCGKVPFNGPICFSIGKEDSKLAVRKVEASYVIVELLK